MRTNPYVFVLTPSRTARDARRSYVEGSMKVTQLVACLLLSVVVGCSNPRNQPLPEDLTQADSDPKFQAAVQKLPEEDRKLLNTFVRFHVEHHKKPTERTIGEAVAATKALVDELNAEADRLHASDAFYEKLPKNEAAFCRAVNRYQDEYAKRKAAGANQLQLSALRSERKTAIEQALTENPGGVLGWIGTIKKLRTDGSGDASVAVALSCEKPVVLANVAKIPKTATVYAVFAKMNVGDPIAVTGRFFPGGSDDPFHELSMTEQGSMVSPEFHFEFTEAASVEK